MDGILLKLKIAEPVRLKLKVDTGYVVVPEQVPASEPLFVASEAAKLQTGDKGRIDNSLQCSEGERYSSQHGGKIGDVSITDDYLYICVKGGAAGSAIWKKAPLFVSQ